MLLKMLLNIFSLLLALATSSNALPPFANVFSRQATVKSSVFEKLAQPPPGWIEAENVLINKDDSTMALRIHLVPQKMLDFHDMAMKVCCRAHPIVGLTDEGYRLQHRGMSSMEDISPKRLSMR